MKSQDIPLSLIFLGCYVYLGTRKDRKEAFFFFYLKTKKSDFLEESGIKSQVYYFLTLLF